MLDIQTDLNRFTDLVFTDYLKHSKLTVEETLRKQGGNLAFFLKQNLLDLKPLKGEIRKQLLERLRGGKGIHIREGVKKQVMRKYSLNGTGGESGRTLKGGRKGGGRQSIKQGGSRLNLQALMVKREISMRESASGFLGVGSRFPRVLPTDARAWSRYKKILGKAGISLREGNEGVRFVWSPTNSQSENMVEGLNKPRAQRAIRLAVLESIDNVNVYIQRKMNEDAAKSFNRKINVVRKLF